MRFWSVAAMLIALLVTHGSAAAHPHVWVSAQTTVMFENSQMARVRHAWTFDEGFSAFAIQGLDANGDGIYTREELQELAEVNVTSLKEFDYFTFATLGETDLPFSEPTNYWLAYQGDRLILHFDLPLQKPVPVSEKLVVDVYDSTFFVDFGFADEQPALLAGSQACSAKVVRPKDLPVDIIDRLNALPADIGELPEELKPYAASLVNGIHVSCA
ncbi:DUF1007 family protein [Coralliovum pocilloporae]|uniref:DUF1007 family protein n=1 Tax=Coralliovum pocilloporae TaxID=3066369 RepID=UPI00330778D5